MIISTRIAAGGGGGGGGGEVCEEVEEIVGEEQPTAKTIAANVRETDRTPLV